MPSSVDASYRLLAARYVCKQAKQLADQLQGVLDAEDIECVHQARVASRRLRAALRMFRKCFRRKRLKQWRKEIRRVTVSLGDARDRDVQIEYLCGVLVELQQPACYPGIARLLVQLEQQREGLQKKVVRAVDRFRESGVLEKMQAEAGQVTFEAKARQLGLQSPYTYRQAEKHIVGRLNEMLPYRDGLDDPEQIERHHALRIAAKRLRYTVEICRPVYQGQLDDTLAAIKRVQTLLGDVHDCDVWLEHLRTFADAERERVTARFGSARPFARLNVGIDYLQQLRRGQRRQAFQELVEYWQELDRRGQWEDLLGTVQARGSPFGGANPCPTDGTAAEVPARREHPVVATPHAPAEKRGNSPPQVKTATNSAEEEALNP